MAEQPGVTTLTDAQVAALREAAEKATHGTWTACRMVHGDRGDDLTPAELGEYVANSVIKSRDASGSSAFLFVSVEKPDGPADVCHVGNGPTSPANAAHIAAASPDVVLALLAERDALKRQVTFLKGELSQLANFNPDWDMLQATRESLQEHQARLRVFLATYPHIEFREWL